MFDLEQFTADCRAALAADRAHRHVREVVARAVADPGSLLSALGEPKRAGLRHFHNGVAAAELRAAAAVRGSTQRALWITVNQPAPFPAGE